MTIGISGANASESARKGLPRVEWIRRAALAAAVLAAIIAGLSRSIAGVDPRLLLLRGESMGIEAYAFYVTGSVVVPVSAAPSYEKAARLAFEGSGAMAFETASNRSGGSACVAASAVTAPDARQAMEAVRRIKAALGSRSSVAVCLTGYTNEPKGATVMDGVQIAVLPNGEVYLGAPLIPITY
ncbi:MAG: hypothetical protein LBH66_04470 [Oscillospiraceae bacterium]|jgi:hypothetical protein|nr:hypothetical protein [Oscillospiraceae bacterium]